MVRTRSLRTQSARHRVDHGTICGRSCAISGHHKPLCACVDRIFINPKFVAPVARKNSGRRRLAPHTCVSRLKSSSPSREPPLISESLGGCGEVASELQTRATEPTEQE